MAYTFNKTPEGNVQVSQDGKVISTGTAQNASSNYGYVDATPNAPKPVSQVGVVSSAQGADTIAQKSKQLSNLSPTPVSATDTGTKTTDTTTKTNNTGTTTTPLPSATKVTLINPTTGQQSVFDDADINKQNIQSLMGSGYQVSETSGNLPSWLVASSTGTSTTPQSKAQADVDSAATDLKTLTDSLSKFTISDADLKAQTDAITAQWNARINDMNKINTAREANINTTGYRLGMQFAGGKGGSFGGIISEEERQGVARIAELEGNKQSAIAAAKTAVAQQNWQVYSKQVDLAQKAYEDKISALKELNTNTIAQNKLIADKLQKITDENNKKQADITKSINDIFTSASKNGAPKSVIDSILNSEDVSSAAQAAGSYLKEGTGVVGEWLAVNRDLQANGHPPMDLQTYMNQDANRKIAVAKASKEDQANRVLSVTEAQALGVPFGTIASDAYGKTINKTPTEAQSRDAAFASRVVQSEPTIKNLQDKIANMGALSYIAQVTAEPDAIGNTFVSDDIRQIRQAERNFLNSILRRESGAAISPSEFAEGNKQYFPQPGDDATTLSNKAANREIQIQNLSKSAGSALPDALNTTGSDIVATENAAKTNVLSFVTNNATSQPEAVNTVKSLKSAGKSYSDILEYLKLQPYYKQ